MQNLLTKELSDSLKNVISNAKVISDSAKALKNVDADSSPLECMGELSTMTLLMDLLKSNIYHIQEQFKVKITEAVNSDLSFLKGMQYYNCYPMSFNKNMNFGAVDDEALEWLNSIIGAVDSIDICGWTDLQEDIFEQFDEVDFIRSKEHDVQFKKNFLSEENNRSMYLVLVWGNSDFHDGITALQFAIEQRVIIKLN